MQLLLIAALAGLLGGSWASPAISATSTASAASASCTGDFPSISAADFIDKLNPGWNLGNTLDAIPDEGSWNNDPVVGSTFDTVKASGFSGVRLPVTWAHHFTGGSPDWTVDPEWLQRVSDVIDMVTSRGMYALVNVHHDSWIWADVTQADANITMIEEKFYRLWYQIGTKLACKSNMVGFEPINEPPCNNADDAAEVNKLNQLFLQALSDSGGFNTKRVVTLVGGGEDSVKTSKWFEAPSNYSNPYAIQFHYYSPYPFIFSAWGKTIWGSSEDKQALSNNLQLMRNNFTDVPLIIGEFGASPTNTEPAARWKYSNFLMHKASELNIGHMLWDNGEDDLDRSTGTWRDPVTLNLVTKTTASTSNSLPDSTENTAATRQWSSAYIFHQAGKPVTSQTLPFILNGNTLGSIADSKGNILKSGSDYTVSEPNITFSESYLSNHFTGSTEPGILDTLTLKFSAGMSPFIQIVQWSTPTLNSTSAAAASVSGSNLAIPISWAGIAKPAAVKAIMADGSIAFADWTKWLGPLQQGRATYNNQWNWDDSHVIITQSAIEAVVSAGQSTVFTFEFYPRDNGVVNAVNFTLTV